MSMASQFKLTCVLLILLALVSACTSKPSQEEFNKIAIKDFALQSNNYTRENDNLFRRNDMDWKRFTFLVVGEIEVNDDEMFPYRGTVYNIDYCSGNLSKVDSLAGKLTKMNQNKLYNECKEKNSSHSQTFLGESFGSAHCGEVNGSLNVISVPYVWGKKSKTWKHLN
jgi:hypothetical protein